jgi:hypothetical protein
MKRPVVLLSVGVLLLACSGGPAGPTPGSQTTTPPAATNPPNVTAEPGTAQPNAGSNEQRARALIPPGATEVSAGSIGNSYQLTLTSDQTLAELEAFWAQAIPAAGLHSTGQFTADGTLTIAFANPDGGIVAANDLSGEQGVTIVISVGTP